MSALNSYRRLTLALTTLVFAYNLLTAYALNNLPDEPLQLATHLSTYCYFAALLALLGFIGARRQNATLVAIFANYLIIDVVLSAVPRLLALSFIPDIRAAVCSRDSIVAFFEAHQPQPAPGTSKVDMMAPADRERLEAAMEVQCGRVLTVLMGLAALGAIIATVIQVLLAMRVSAYSRALLKIEAELNERRAQEVGYTKYHDEPKTHSSPTRSTSWTELADEKSRYYDA